MKSSTLLKSISAGTLALGLLVAPLTLPASAQVGTDAEPAGIIYRNDNDFDWSWLGLLGLIGLAGLAGKKRQEPTAYREPTSTTRY
jgi:hypothetical protein